MTGGARGARLAVRLRDVTLDDADLIDAWNVGIALVPDARGHGHGTEAQALLAAYVFENTDANRVEAQPDIDNIAEQRSLEKAGFVREGTARGAQFRAGPYHDLVSYSILRDDR